MKSIQNEKDYTTKFFNKAKKLWYWIYKIADVWFARKPFDSVLRTNRWDYYIEFKVAPTPKTNIERLLKPHQIKNLTHISKLGGKAIVIVWYKKTLETALYSIDDLDNPILVSQELHQVFDYLP